MLVAFLGIAFFRRHSPRFMNGFALPGMPINPDGALVKTLGFPAALEMSAYYALIYIVAFVALVKKIPNRHILFLVPLVYFPFWNLGQDMGIRMFMNAVPLGIALLLYLVWLIGQRKRLSERPVKSARRVQAKPVFSLAMSLVLLVALMLTPGMYDPKKDPPYEYYKAVIRDIDLDEDTLLIAHLGLNHVYTYYKDLKDCLNWLPDFYVPEGKAWRIAYGINARYVRSFFPEFTGPEGLSPIRGIDANYTLIREDLWQAYLALEDEEIAQAHRNWFNPYELRPRFIRGN